MKLNTNKLILFLLICYFGDMCFLNKILINAVLDFNYIITYS